MKSVFAGIISHHHVNSTQLVPKEFHDATLKFVTVLKSELDDNEVRALASNKVASPLLQVHIVQHLTRCRLTHFAAYP